MSPGAPKPLHWSGPWFHSLPPTLGGEGRGGSFSSPRPTSQVLRNRGVYENVKYGQQENFWIGPSSVRAGSGWAGRRGRGAGRGQGLSSASRPLARRRPSFTWVQSSRPACARTRRCIVSSEPRGSGRSTQLAAFAMTGPAACRPRRRSARCVPLPTAHALICAGCVCGRVVTSDGARWVILYLRSRHITPSLKSRSLRFHSPIPPSYPADRCNGCVCSFCTCLVFVPVPTVYLSGISFIQVELITESPSCTFLECK